MESSVQKIYRVLGLMSGTSLDGVDLACCKFTFDGYKWNYHVVDAITVSYSEEWRNALGNAQQLDARGLAMLNVNYGRYLGKLAKDFINLQPHVPQLIASHGHTVFHIPQSGLTLQIGHGAELAAITGINTVCDFRSQDVALGGQGAPLVPIGDRLLFGDFDICINLGGFSNISFNKNDQRIAFDISPVNIVLNHLARMAGMEFDRGGAMAASGKIHTELLSALNDLSFYKKNPPKSLGREWVEEFFNPLLNVFDISIADKLRTVTEHIVIQLDKNTSNLPPAKMLITGGGAHNGFLIQRLEEISKHHMIIPDEKTVDFKEAIIFAFLGLLRLLDQPNCLASVTGASRDHVSGAIYYGK